MKIDYEETLTPETRKIQQTSMGGGGKEKTWKLKLCNIFIYNNQKKLAFGGTLQSKEKKKTNLKKIKCNEKEETNKEREGHCEVEAMNVRQNKQNNTKLGFKCQ